MTLSRKTAKNEALPKGWRRVKLGEFGTFYKGKGITKADLIEDGIPCLRYAEIYTKYDGIVKELSSFISPDAATKATPIQSGDVIFAASGETATEIGKAIAFVGRYPAVTGGDTVIFRDHGQEPAYLAHMLNSADAARQKARLGKGQSVVHIHVPELFQVEVPLPPLHEQRKIAEILATWDTAIEKTEALIAAKEKQLKWLLKTFISDEQGNNGWRRVRLNTVASVKTGPFGAQLHQHDYVQSNGTPIVTVEHLGERGLIHKNLPLVSHHDKQRLSQYLIQEGDIVFSRVGSVDRSSLASKDEDGWLFSGRLLRVRPKRCDVYSSYLNYFFHTRKFRHHMKSIAVGGTMPSINTNILSNVIVPLPSMDEQKAIASLLETWDMAIEKTKALAEQYRTQKRGLMQKLLTGKWRIQTGDN